MELETYTPESKSQRFKLNTSDWKKIFTGAGLAFGPALLIFIGELTLMNFGRYTLFIAALLSVIANAIRKWIKDNSAS